MQPRKQFQQFQKLGDKIFRVPRVEPWRIPLALVRVPKFQSISVAVVIWGFAAIIALGAILLMLPISRADPASVPLSKAFPDALFTATSATCVTGLTVHETGTYWSPFGQAVILVLMQIGGFGFMASASLLLLAFGRSVGLREKLLIGESMGMQKLGGLVSLLMGIAFFTLFFEGIGAVIFYVRFSQDFSSPATALWHSLFHSVSSFCNAGFDIFGGGSLMGYNNDPLVLLTTAALIILGGMSFLVAWDIFRKRSFRRLSLDSKLVIVMTAALLAMGTIILLAMEYNNGNTLGSMPFSQKLLNAFFQSVTPRTAGFNVISVGMMTAYSLFFTIMLMFVGGASGSTAGGVKVSTFGVLIATVWSSLKGKEHAEAFGRELRPQQIHRALAVAMLSLGLVAVVVLILTITEDQDFIKLLFETVSAFGTVGLSTGITPALTMAGKFIIIVTMFAGRLGPLTLALSLVQGQRVTEYRYPQDQVRIG
ncbi:MAG: Trk family potassium uptake protein [Dehalococcoidia bacterium]|nr:Trk family potassium uptake protein [Dehalococcoidia bacterium]